MIEVNADQAGDQSHPVVAMDNAGNFVIAWQSDGQDGDGLEIYARRFDYDNDGNLLATAVFPVNSTAEGNQSAPTIARARVDGQYVIGWQSEVLGEEGEVDVEVLATLYGSDGSVLVDEFAVNTTSEHDQVGPHVAMGAYGNFVFAWTAEGQMGSGADVFARRFGSDGTGLEDNFRVNETTRQGQQYPAVGIDAAGNFIVSWQSSHQDGFSWGMFAKVYDVDRNVLAEELQVNVNVQGPQTNPAVNANSQGTAIVTWLGLDAQHQPAVHAQRYELPTTEGSEFTVGPEGENVLSNYVALEEATAAAAVDANGNYIVAWQSYGQDGSGLGVFARRFNAAGDPLDDAFLVTNTTDGNQSQPDVAVDDSGKFIIAWQSADLNGSGYDIFARRFDENGNADGNEFRVNTIIAGQQGKPALAIDPDDGSAVIVWQGPDGEVTGSGIFGQRYKPNGSPDGGEFQLNTFTALDQVSPTISMNANGEYVVAWVSDHRAEFDPIDTEKSIFVQWYNKQGRSVGPEVLVHSIQPDYEAQELADVAIDPDGNFVIAWQSINQDGNTWGVFARQFLADKSPVQPIEFQVNQTVLAPQRHASVASDSEGNFVVSWQGHAQDTSGPGVFARVYDAAAVPQTDEFLVPTWDQGPQTWPVMAMTVSGEFGVFWTGHGTDRAEGVHGRLYGRQQPDLQVSITDDGVKVAPGESIVYTITYENVGNVETTGVVITLSPPIGTTYVAAGSTPGWTAADDGTFTYSVDTIAAGDVAEPILLAVSAPLVVDPGVSKFTATVSIADDGTHGEDQTLENNVATETTPFIKRGSAKKLDVNGDGRVSPNDALIVINQISRKGSSKSAFASSLVADVNEDGQVSSLDALIVINHVTTATRLQESIEARDRYIASLAPTPDLVDRVSSKYTSSDELEDTIDLLVADRRF